MNTTIRHIKTIIVGAGPAGSVCGYILAKNKQECLIIERKEFPRDKTCGGGLTPKSVRLLERIYTDLKYDYQTVYQMEIYSRKQLLANFRMSEGIRTVIRKDFDNVLLSRYKEIGGEVLHAKAASIEEKENRIYLTLGDKSVVSCDYLIGADGANSIVRKYIDPNHSKGLVWMEKSVADKSEKNIKIFFDKRYKMGYGYLFPNENGYVVGYGHAGTPSLNEFDDMLEHYDLSKEGKIRGAYIPTMDNIDYEFRKNIILIGDAGSYTDSVTSEGLFYAMKTGENAATSILVDKEFKEVNQRIILRIRKIRNLALLFYSGFGQWIFYRTSKRKSLYNRICKTIDSYIAK
ncbi:NAD(P)/FAD-dependent oxidoreductase [Dysgonomonas macrotermitis]|uniref:Geranylgeranyl reductase family n=1 Tax=Dysgonomonas macrotermitis TaxID=1346286 RepID=A0A1M4SV79_9BACT|nr:geranylgeranyl reductase family protein [Dysgonomonas macrotermitis]SHE36141.1 geranylgeranyl reductase family [Dysgonomonas macrotermitis]